MRKGLQYNIEKFLQKYNIPYKYVSSNSEIVINCIFHEDNKNKLYISADKGLFNCFVCNETGTFRDLVKRMALNKKKDINLSDFQETVDRKPKPVILTEDERIEWPPEYQPLFVQPQGRPVATCQGEPLYEANQYLLNRGLSEAQIYYYRIGVCMSGRYRGRIIVPTFNAKEELVTFVARDYTGELKPKVLTPPAKNGTHGVKDYVFNLHRAASLGHFIIGEGVFDAISLGTRGIALFGKAATDIQLAKIINKKPQRITIVLDPDARTEAEKLANQFIMHCPDVKIAYLPDGVDPNSVDRNLLEITIKNAIAPKSGSTLEFIC
jgi:DNA primase